MHFKTVILQDSIVNGFWKKGKYFGPYEKQYIVVATTNMISKVECRLTDKRGEVIFITVHQIVLKHGLANAAQPPTITELFTTTRIFCNKNNPVQ